MIDVAALSHSALSPCTTFSGNSTVVRRPPNFSVYDALFVPGRWGLYDHGRRLITDTAYFRGPVPELIGTNYKLDPWPTDVDYARTGQSYYYVGGCHAHYGHFLLASFSRLWALDRFIGKKPKLVISGTINETSRSYIEPLLKSIGYSLDDCITFQKPTVISDIAIAAPSFEETNFVHTEYARLCQTAAHSLVVNIQENVTDQPLYLAKFNLKSGVVKLDNEEIIANALQKRGVRVVFPEDYSIGEQIRLFADHSHIVGLIGSAFHTASFVTGKRLLMMNYRNATSTNQLLIDKIGRHSALYVYPRDIVQCELPGFSTAWSLTKPYETAEGLLNIMDAFVAEGAPIP